jgi:hypothetical protein
MEAYIEGHAGYGSKGQLYNTLVNLACLVDSAFLRQPEKKQIEELMEALKKAIMRDADN